MGTETLNRLLSVCKGCERHLQSKQIEGCTMVLAINVANTACRIKGVPWSKLTPAPKNEVPKTCLRYMEMVVMNQK